MLPATPGTLWCYAAMGNAWRMGINRVEETDLVLPGTLSLRPASHLFAANGNAGRRSPVAAHARLLRRAGDPLHLHAHQGADEEAYLCTVHGDAYRDYLCLHRRTGSHAAAGAELPRAIRAETLRPGLKTNAIPPRLIATSNSMSEPLAGKIALVTGGSRGIGRAIALKLANAGCDVAMVYHTSQEEAEAVCAAIRHLGRRSLALCRPM